MELHPEITIYTDGSSRGNPGPGGYGAILIYKGVSKSLSEGFRRTTNNRMELLGVIKALEAIKILQSNVTIFTDSKYVADAINQNWLQKWINKGFKKVKNPDLWIRFIKIYNQHNVRFVWVKGHADNFYNNQCDQMAVAAATSENLHIDEEFERNENLGNDTCSLF